MLSDLPAVVKRRLSALVNILIIGMLCAAADASGRPALVAYAAVWAFVLGRRSIGRSDVGRPAAASPASPSPSPASRRGGGVPTSDPPGPRRPWSARVF